MPTVLDWNPATNPDDIIRPVKDCLASGGIAILPSRAGYLAVVAPDSLAAKRLVESRDETDNQPPSILVFGPDDATRFGLAVPPIAARLMNRIWPGPLIVALPTLPENQLFDDWPAAVKEAVAFEGVVRFRSPDHPLFDALFAVFDQPLLVFDTGGDPKVLAAGLNDVAVLISAGDLVGEIRPTLVRVEGGSWSIVADGAFSRPDLEKLASRLILFICTGNTCRSPMAEALCKKLLADRLSCRVDELPAKGYWVMSAGVAAYAGGAATANAVNVVAEWGADLTAHRSRPVNPQILAAADAVITMTMSHASALVERYPGFGPPARLLCEDGDLTDPIGGDEAIYRECAQTIHQQLERLISEWVGP